MRWAAGSDRLDGGAGIDTISYYTVTGNVVLDLAAGVGVAVLGEFRIGDLRKQLFLVDEMHGHRRDHTQAHVGHEG